MIAGSAAAPVEILMVEDNPGDVRLVTEILRGSAVANRVSVVGDGVQALSYLRREGRHEQAVRPNLVLLDLNLPLKGGRDVLSAMKADGDLRAIPVIVLTTSESPDEVADCYRRQASCFVSKPSGIDEFFNAIRAIDRMWLTIAALPEPAG